MSSAARQRRPINVQEAAVICEAFSCAETRTGRCSIENVECLYIWKVLAGVLYFREYLPAYIYIVNELGLLLNLSHHHT